ncbi:MAG TPA: DPP IV N-terminal domain-containing protein [Bryobacteraceae bacterium]|nr:DPP IV N-terminal domain-containing protein [Bryobacteraceae bacterium]
MFVRFARLAGALAAGLFAVGAAAQQPKQFTAADYAHSEKFLGPTLNPLVYHSVERPTWLEDGRFWYRDVSAEGTQFVVVNPAAGVKGPAFDHAKLAVGLAEATGKPVNAHKLAITGLELADGDKTVTVTVARSRYKCDLSGAGTCVAVKGGAPAAPGVGRGGRPEAVTSPDKSKAAFIRNWNLWIRDVATGNETQLTTDGVENYGYATDNAGWTHSNRAILAWSADSKKIATFQQDQRKTGEMYLVPVVVGHPKLQVLKYPLTGDENVTMIERVIIDVDSRKVLRLKAPPDQHRSTLCDDVACGEGWPDTQWSGDGKTLAFVSTSRDHKQEWFKIADATTGDVREVMSETVATFYESGNGRVNWKYLPESNELLWFSERDNWGQLYLYDLTSGKLKSQVTHGDGNVTEVLRVDQKTRTLWFVGVGKEQGRDPYYRQFYKIGLDGKGLTLLSPENADHTITLSQDGKYFVDAHSTPEAPGAAVVRAAADGKVVLPVATTDISKLAAAGWVPDVPFTVKGRDGSTDLYGMLWKPATFDAAKKYPIINYVYPGPQTGSCGNRSFAATRGDRQALAELGFIVVCIDGMGTPGRTKKFHEAYFGDLGDNTIPDQVAGMQQLAAKYPWIDLQQAGIWGHSGGGNATAAAMFHYPDFFKVGIAESGNHDNRVYEDDWAEKWSGLVVKNADGTSNYDSQANQNYAKNLKGRLLLMHGTMDDNVPPNETLLLVDALIKANKDFDLIMIPNVPHGYGVAGPYAMRRRWDYFVRYLQGGEPPKEYQMKPQAPNPEAAGTED